MDIDTLPYMVDFIVFVSLYTTVKHANAFTAPTDFSPQTSASSLGMVGTSNAGKAGAAMTSNSSCDG